MKGIYQIRNKINNKRYIGSSNDIYQRIHRHRWALKYKKHENPRLQNAWNKYGGANFAFEVIEECSNSEDLVKLEQEYLNSNDNLYNIATDARIPPKGYKQSKEQKRNHSKKMKLWYKTHTNPFKNKKHSTESKQKISQSNKGHIAWNKNLEGEGKPYPAFYNVKTKEVLPAGRNLAKLCRIHNLKIDSMRGIRDGFIIESRDGWRLYTMNYDYNYIAIARQKTGNAHAKPYPAFYNSLTNDLIPAGINLRKMCGEHNLNYSNMQAIVRREHLQTKDGWKLDTNWVEGEEIK